MARDISSNKTRFRPSVEPTEADLAAVRLSVLNQASTAAFGASTLEEAQAILGAASPGLTDDITIDVEYTDVTSAAPATSSTGTYTVPTGNPGDIIVNFDSIVPPQYSLNGGAFATVGDGLLTIADADTLAFRRNGAGVVTINVQDATKGSIISPDFTLTAT